MQTLLQKIEENEVAAFADRIGLCLIGQSTAASGLREMANIAAQNDAPLLITGAQGSGKRDIAAVIHARSERCAAPFLHVNCNHMDSEYQNINDFDKIRGGTILLEDLSDLLPSQYNLLQELLEDKDFQIICSTTKESSMPMHIATARPDIYAKLSTLCLPVPPLSKRRPDIGLLIEAHIQSLSHEHRFTLERAALNMLTSYDWPRNITELKGFTERAGKLFGGTRLTKRDANRVLNIKSFSLPKKQQTISKLPKESEDGGFNLHLHLAQEERKFMTMALEQSGGVVQRAAKMVGLKRTTFIAKMHKYGL